MTVDPLQAERHDERIAAERRQGELIARGAEDAWGWQTPAGIIRADRRGRFLIKAAGLGSGVAALELGCGTGEFTARLVASGCDLTAVDVSEATAAICRDRLGASARVVVGDIEHGAGVDGPFDAIVGVSVLHHVDLEACLATTFPKLRPGGRFAFSEPNMLNPQVWAERHLAPLRKLRHVTPHETAFRAAELRTAFERAGLVVETCRPFEFLHPATPQRAIHAVLAIERVAMRTPLRAIAGSILVAGCRP
jgi:SAM-dependent methyltransferase